ncbi:uncharacterized protein LOC110992064 [Pieris rapae]|uniref:uncharacterized protein LOC110992064 n=1 Tax=Pieris rapae TaxID=64459 RepID=UPI001E27B619|nr:uncharacterized protein LOC110992064 [Pieris rapae]
MEVERCPSEELLSQLRSLVKPILFVALAAAALYVPLGDPRDRCCSSETAKQRITNTSICQLYYLSVKLYQKFMEFLEFAVTMLIDILYELKLKFYTLLGKLDSKDLCRSICCYDSDTEEKVPKKESRHRTCNCIQSRCSKRKSRQIII